MTDTKCTHQIYIFYFVCVFRLVSRSTWACLQECLWLRATVTSVPSSITALPPDWTKTSGQKCRSAITALRQRAKVSMSNFFYIITIKYFIFKCSYFKQEWLQFTEFTSLLPCSPQLFRRTLVRMFESQELDCVFMETHMDPRKRQHMVLECLPLPRELGDMAPIYFKVCSFSHQSE